MNAPDAETAAGCRRLGITVCMLVQTPFCYSWAIVLSRKVAKRRERHACAASPWLRHISIPWLPNFQDRKRGAGSVRL